MVLAVPCGDGIGQPRDCFISSSGMRMRDEECVRLLKSWLPRLGYRWSGYRKVHRTVCKRLHRRLGELGLSGVGAYQDRLELDPAERSHLDAMCRIPISRFYRDRSVFDALRNTVLPNLVERAVARPDSMIRCWSCGCASGEEAYSLRIIWEFTTPPGARGYHILATDADPTMLKRAKRGCYQPGSLRELPAPMCRRAFARSGQLYCVRPEFRSAMTFEQQDVRSTLPTGTFDLILCRNVVFTYFERSLQLQVMRELTDHLEAGGFLVIGQQEHLPSDLPRIALESPELPIYSKGL